MTKHGESIEGRDLGFAKKNRRIVFSVDYVSRKAARSGILLAILSRPINLCVPA